jgi:hypothetical protein
LITDFQTNAYDFLSGAAMMGAWVCGLHFMRFWRRTGDRFFLLFALAFWSLAIERIGLIFVDPKIEDRQPVIYLIRLIAFLLILAAVWVKNRPPRRT